ncbi:hypothetical protein SAMN05444007_107246 [Cribrihabitans marinus]|uniref:Uncharacterized protein n=1 Tax=Cribrihabitans marinus TaxID=1227549 RepID=A0A1H7BZL4_9RHOB|nr:hypothetical protein [Cribrihabitans marinus]SEJ82464.1 hypothetical protein SAMN05444007_107246 [Cribrihabitans marinus]
MTSILTFTPGTQTRRAPAPRAMTQNVVSMDDWRNAPHPIRTPHGVFFVTNVWGSSGDAA